MNPSTVGFGAKKNKHKPKDSMHLNGHDEMGSELRVTIPTGSKDVEAVTPTSTISSGFGTLVHSVNDPAVSTVISEYTNNNFLVKKIPFSFSG